MIVRKSHDAEARLRKAVQRAVEASVKAMSAAEVADALSATEHSVRRWADGAWPSYPNAVRIAPILGVEV